MPASLRTLDFRSVDQLGRKELQYYAKTIKVRANQKNGVLRRALKMYISLKRPSMTIIHEEDDRSPPETSQENLPPNPKHTDPGGKAEAPSSNTVGCHVPDLLVNGFEPKKHVPRRESLSSTISGLDPSVQAILARSRVVRSDSPTRRNTISSSSTDAIEEKVISPRSLPAASTLVTTARDLALKSIDEIVPKSPTDPSFQTPGGDNPFLRRWNAIPYHASQPTPPPALKSALESTSPSSNPLLPNLPSQSPLPLSSVAVDLDQDRADVDVHNDKSGVNKSRVKKSKVKKSKVKKTKVKKTRVNKCGIDNGKGRARHKNKAKPVALFSKKHAPTPIDGVQMPVKSTINTVSRFARLHPPTRFVFIQN
ncbi:hypothetical protein AAMO2058_000787900 [Amorphochlora amoebiformis]